MKNYYTKLAFILFMIPVVMLACENQSNNPTDSQKFEKISKIKNDTVFTNLYSNTFKTLQQVKDPELAKKLSAKGKDITPAETEQLAKALGFKNKEYFIQNYKNYRKSIDYLNNKYNYSKYGQEKIKSLAMASPELQKSIPQMAPVLYGVNDCESNCKRIAKDKVIAATAAAVVAHAGCATADAILIGAICHAAVIAGQSALSDQAYAEMKQCINNCKDDAE